MIRRTDSYTARQHEESSRQTQLKDAKPKKSSERVIAEAKKIHGKIETAKEHKYIGFR